MRCWGLNSGLVYARHTVLQLYDQPTVKVWMWVMLAGTGRELRHTDMSVVPSSPAWLSNPEQAPLLLCIKLGLW